MTPPLHQPHDYLFRLVFADPEETAAFLRARLPGSHQRGILWPSLRRAAGSFIDQELRGSVTDLLFEVRSAAAAPRQWLYLLFEHQSQPDRWMALRLLRYCRRIWEADRRDYPDEQYLRPVLPLVFYQGEHHWHYAIELAESFPPALRGQPWVPRFCPLLLDQTRMAPAAVAGELHGRVAATGDDAHFRAGAGGGAEADRAADRGSCSGSRCAAGWMRWSRLVRQSEGVALMAA